MEIYRIPPYPLTADFSDLTIDTAHLLSLYNSRTELEVTVSATSDGSGDISFVLPTSISDYDDEYRGLVHEGTLETDTVVASDNIKVVRPYLIPADILPAGGVLADYVKYERIARTSIDNMVGGFYFSQMILDLQGMGNDKLTLGQRVNDIVSVVRNNEVVYDRAELDADNEELYTLTADYQSMITVETVATNIIDGRVPTTIPAPSSYGNTSVRVVDFPAGWNFAVRIENGWSYVPQDIQEASQLLIDDLACLSPSYLNKYVREYETKDFRVDIHRPGFAGTGNLLVDQILQKYLGDTLYNGIRVL